MFKVFTSFLILIIYSLASNPVDHQTIIIDSQNDSINKYTLNFTLSTLNMGKNRSIFRSIEKRSLATIYEAKTKKLRKFANKDRIGSCRKFDFNVNFVDLGWEKWIIFPKMFNAYFCGGSCSLPLTIRQKSLSLTSSSDSANRTISDEFISYKSVQVTNHAQIMSILEYKHPELNQQMTKCVSTKLKPLTVIFLDEYGQIKTKQYDDMIVEECGCR